MQLNSEIRDGPTKLKLNIDFNAGFNVENKVPYTSQCCAALAGEGPEGAPNECACTS